MGRFIGTNKKAAHVAALSGEDLSVQPSLVFDMDTYNSYKKANLVGISGFGYFFGSTANPMTIQTLGADGQPSYVPRSKTFSDMTNDPSVPWQIGDKLSQPIKIASTGILTSAGELWLWGDNTHGQLGQNDTVNRSSPVQIDGTWIDFQAMVQSTIAIKSDGTLWSWGRNHDGRLGQGDTVSRSSPAQIGALTNWTKVSGRGSIGAAMNSSGQIYCWGENGGFINNSVVSRSSPVQLSGASVWTDCVVGGDFTGAVKNDGTLWAWGPASQAWVFPTNANRSSPVQIGTDTDWKYVFQNTENVAFAMRTNGNLWGWGLNNNGGVGDTTTTSRSSPVQVAGMPAMDTSVDFIRKENLLYNGRSIKAIANTGALYTWGWNVQQQLYPYSTSDPTTSPVQVGSDTDWYGVVVYGSGTHFTVKQSAHVD